MYHRGSVLRLRCFCCSPPIISVFADHDFGCDNSDSTYEFKYESGLAFVDFLGEPVDSAVRQRAEAGHGVYGVKFFDFALPFGDQEIPDWVAGVDADVPLASPTENESNQTVAVFFLDVRTSKTPWKQGAERFQPDFEGDYLGERQWQWFEQSIRRSRASVNVVVNGLQVFANRYSDGNTAESWEKYPVAQQRLFDALLQGGVESPILISGDVHMTQMMRKDCARKGERHPKRTLVELTTSGMTHSWGTISTPIEDPDKKPTLLQRYRSFAGLTLMHSLHYLCPWTDILISTPSENEGLHETGGGEGATTGLQYSLLQNFGELEFDWKERTVSLRSIGKTLDRPPLLMAKFSMDQLSGRQSVPSPHLTSKDFHEETKSTRHQLYSSDWVCVNHRGRDSVLAHSIGHGSTLLVLITVVPLPLLLPAFLLLLVARRLSQRYSSSHWHETRIPGRKRRMLKRLVKGKLPKGMRVAKLLPLRYKTYASMAKRDMQRLARVKVSKGVHVVPVSMMCRDFPQFT